MYPEQEEELREGEGRRNFMRDVKAALRDAGFPVLGSAFPYAMHHNFYRAKIKVSGKKAKHHDVSRLLLRWMSEREEPADYAWQCVTGAVKEMMRKDPSLVPKLPPEVRKGMASVEDGYAFLRWLRSQDMSALVLSSEH